MELWQLYGEDGNALVGKGAGRDDVYSGMLHGAAHVWIWRVRNRRIEILIQKRALNKLSWPNMWDIAAAGHINLGEDPLTAAIRETKEEIGFEALPDELVLITCRRDRLSAPNGIIENEFRWVYALRLEEEFNFTLEEAEVAELAWRPFSKFRQEVEGMPNKPAFVPQGPEYFKEVFDYIENLYRTK